MISKPLHIYVYVCNNKFYKESYKEQYKTAELKIKH